MPKQKRILYVHHYGDQHGTENVKTIGDGGSNIHIHLIKKLEEKYKITISTYADNYVSHGYFSKSKNARIVEHWTISGVFKKKLLFYEFPLRCLYPGLKYLFSEEKYDYVVTQTDFLPDVITGVIVKIRNPKTTWVASYFLDAPKPWDKETPYKGNRWFIGLFYWLLQRPSFWLIRSLADFVLVTSQPDQPKFITVKRDMDKAIIARGGVDIEPSERYLHSKQIVPINKRLYDACFVGRFHYQKGVLELLDIWKYVIAKRSDAKLAIIGAGPLKDDVAAKIKRLRLESSVELLGYRSGEEKFAIFKQSKLMVHPATYDSGGMAAAEGLAWGLPGVAFDLESLKTYYPKGMLKVRPFDKKEFANKILQLLTDKKLYTKTTAEARDLILSSWDWRRRVELIYKPIFA